MAAKNNDNLQEHRKCSPSVSRNRQPIFDVLDPILAENSHILEIASGSGEHAFHICHHRRDITWQPSDIDPSAQESQKAWGAICEGNMLSSININVMEEGWEKKLGKFSGIFCANMIHIAPWAATQALASGAAKLLDKNGFLILYGPFLIGVDTAESNIKFDASLKARNVEWGVRDLTAVKHIFAMAGFNDVQKIAMPSNNLILVFRRS